LSFNIRYSKHALKSLKLFSQVIRRRVLERIEELQDNPFPRGTVKIHDEDNLYRLRVGDYRVLYEVYPKEGLVLIIKIDHRSTVYTP